MGWVLPLRDGKPLQSHILIDLRKYGRFAAAKRDLESFREPPK